MIIGVTGLFASGKDSVAEYLISKGFVHYSLSDAIREELNKKNIPLTRENLQNVATQMRQAFGNAVFAEKVYLKLEDDKNYVITSIRHPDEVKVFLKKKEFHLVDVSAPMKIRFERIKARNRENDPKTLKAFQISEAKESGKTSNSQNIPAVRKMAKYVILNDRDIEILNKKIERFLKDVHKRPDWDEYFLDIMKSVGKRATCDRGRAGSVIVKNKQILTTGYVGAPAGLGHCDEDGHLFEQRLNEDGTTSKHCIRTTHAEQNAIVQAAKHGVPIDGATLYCKMVPCRDCAKMIINSGIKRVVAEKMYQKGGIAIKWFKEAGVKLEVINDETEKY